MIFFKFKFKRMKKIICILSIAIISFIAIPLIAQDFSKKSLNQAYLDTYINKAILYGYCDVEGLRKSIIFKHSYNRSMKEYSIDSNLVLSMTDKLNDVQIKIVFASWCSDSQREVPRFIEILKVMDYPMDLLTIIAVDRNKEVEEIDISNLNINLVPTFIFTKNDIEIGRIIEMPISTLESDIVEILFKTN